jgi:hypothetical protein
MNSVDVTQLGKRIAELLGINEGEAIDLSKLRDGSIMIRKAEAPGAQP